MSSSMATVRQEMRKVWAIAMAALMDSNRSADRWKGSADRVGVNMAGPDGLFFRERVLFEHCSHFLFVQSPMAMGNNERLRPLVV